MQNPKISIIVPIYKAENHLCKCIDSILLQTFSNFELLLIDDGSPDRSGDICDEYARKDFRIKVFHKDNGGVSSARNYGLEQANAKWLCFIDSDDWIESDFLNAFEVDNLHKTDIIFQNILFDFENNENKKKKLFQYDDILLKIGAKEISSFRILHDGFPFAKLYNNEIIKQHNLRFLKELSIHEDHLFVWGYLKHVKRIKLSSSSAYHYMQRNAMTLSRKFHSSEEYLLASDKFISALKVLNVYLCINNSHYFNRVCTDYGLTQLLRACRNVNTQNYRNIFAHLRMKQKLFSQFYISQRLSTKLILFLLFYRILPNIVLFYLLVVARALKVRIKR